MSSAEILTWVAAALVLPLTLWLVRKSRVLTPSRQRLIAALSIPTALLIALFWFASNERILAIPVAMLFFSFVLLLSIYAWKTDSMLSYWAEQVLTRRPTIQDRFQQSPILGKLVKRKRT